MSQKSTTMRSELINVGKNISHVRLYVIKPKRAIEDVATWSGS